jgi:hypothetical protein
MKILAIYDNGGKTFDQYTAYFDFIEKEQQGKKFYSCLGMSGNPFHPQGFCQHSSGMLGKHNGKRITFDQLPADCQKAVNEDLSETAKEEYRRATIQYFDNYLAIKVKANETNKRRYFQSDERKKANIPGNDRDMVLQSYTYEIARHVCMIINRINQIPLTSEVAGEYKAQYCLEALIADLQKTV